MFRNIVILLQYFLFFRTIISSERRNIFNVSLNEDSSLTLHWSLNYNSETVRFEVHAPPDYGWYAIGFSDRGELFPADYCLLSRSTNGKMHMQDVHSNEEGIVILDKKQDCKDFQLKIRNGVLKYTFRRSFDTCDVYDYIIEDGTTHIVWTRGKHNLFRVNGLNISTPPDDNGMVRVDLLKNIYIDTDLPSHVKTLDILADNVKVPSDETTYWCHVHKLSNDYQQKHHIYQYEANIQHSSHGLVHHMELFHCETDADMEIPLYVGNCFAKDRPPATQVCKRVLAAWAMGAPPFTYPEEASLPLGGENFNPYVMLEVHYNNPERRSDFVDSSGIRLHVSTKLKEMDAGVIELGLEYTDKMAIPPGQELFPLTGYCISACTGMGLPANGITIFGSQLHTHLTGVAVYTRHFDAYGTELPELNRDNHFSTHFQEIRRLKRPVQVLPGHVLITRCDYNTEDRENVTLGGFQISDEMCVNYVHYYPHTDLEVCKSSISNEALETYFRYMNEWEDQDTSPSKGISDNYKAINWNKMRIQLLNEVYNEAPLSMQCNMSSGDRFPGYWENAALPPILNPLPPPTRSCEDEIF